MQGLCKDAECVNTRGSFRCTCKPGTMLDPSRSHCICKCSREPLGLGWGSSRSPWLSGGCSLRSHLLQVCLSYTVLFMCKVGPLHTLFFSMDMENSGPYRAWRGHACSVAAEDTASWVEIAPTGAGFAWVWHWWGNGLMAQVWKRLGQPLG